MRATGCKPNIVIYNTLLGSFLRAGNTFGVFKIYDEMLKDGIPADESTWSILGSCGGFNVHSQGFQGSSTCNSKHKK
jgi:pentatricopeptide repeat protein